MESLRAIRCIAYLRKVRREGSVYFADVNADVVTCGDNAAFCSRSRHSFLLITPATFLKEQMSWESAVLSFVPHRSNPVMLSRSPFWRRWFLRTTSALSAPTSFQHRRAVRPASVSAEIAAAFPGSVYASLRRLSVTFSTESALVYRSHSGTPQCLSWR